ncbi:MAG: hypothetical protein OXL96_13920 [Candidatus Poribacteria bacterium]|nr:hypothetical protein [Candidatus Poribacteria bacterium]
METLSKPQFIAFIFTVGVPILCLVWNQIKTNKKMIESDKRLHQMLEAQQERHEEIVRVQSERHEEIMRIQERREEMLRVTLNSVEKHIQESNKDHAVLMDRTAKDM